MDLMITYSDTNWPAIRDAICTRFGYNAATDGTKKDFAIKQMKRWGKRIYEESLRTAAVAAAITQAKATADAAE